MISEKQKKILAFPYTKFEALICDGAIRSGKTSIMTVAFVDWAMREFNNTNFAICGKTVSSAIKNIVEPYMSIGYPKWRGLSVNFTRNNNKLVVKLGNKTNNFYVYGGKDEGSSALIQGITLGGVLLDEVALMPRSFVEQALARCSVSGSKFWFNCNPENPFHWFYLEWIEPIIKGESKSKTTLYLHFELKDNPSLTPEIMSRYESLYSGVFYDRYIRGMWVQAEGLIYPMFNKDFHIVPTIPRPYSKYYVSCDYGTVNPMSMGLWGLADGKWYRIKEFYHNSRTEKVLKTDEEYYHDLLDLVSDLPIQKVIVDPSAASFIQTIRKHGKLHVAAANNDVSNGIRGVATALNKGLIFINDCCTASIMEFGLYVWDSKAKEDKPIKENDHAMDEIRYFSNTIFRNKNTVKSHNFTI